MTLLMVIWYFLCPSYRRKIDSQFGWNLAFKAASYLLLKKEFDQGDIDAARIINGKMRELNGTAKA